MPAHFRGRMGCTAFHSTEAVVSQVSALRTGVAGLARREWSRCVAKLGHTGACALPIGGCALPLEVCPTVGGVPYCWRCALPTVNNYRYPKLPRAQRLGCVCGRWLNLHGEIEQAMLTLSGQLTSGVARHGPSRARPDLLVTYHAYLISFHKVLYNQLIKLEPCSLR